MFVIAGNLVDLPLTPWVNYLAGFGAILLTFLAGAEIDVIMMDHGTLVFVALPADNAVTLPIFETVLGAITITGSIVGTRTDLREVFALHAAGKTKVIREVRQLEAINESIADVEAGRVAARIVFGF